MTKPLRYYIGYLDPGNWKGTLYENFGDYLQLMNLQHKLAARACIAYWLFHQEVVQNSLGEYTLVEAAKDTMLGWMQNEGEAFKFCWIASHASNDDLEALIECLTHSICSEQINR